MYYGQELYYGNQSYWIGYSKGHESYWFGYSKGYKDARDEKEKNNEFFFEVNDNKKKKSSFDYRGFFISLLIMTILTLTLSLAFPESTQYHDLTFKFDNIENSYYCKINNNNKLLKIYDKSLYKFLKNNENIEVILINYKSIFNNDLKYPEKELKIIKGQTCYKTNNFTIRKIQTVE